MLTVIELPKPPSEAHNQAQWTELVAKFRALRLRALQVAPGAFASTYESESQRRLDQTFDRLRNPKARQFVATEDDRLDASNSTSPAGNDVIKGICRSDWVGMIVLIGPMEERVTARQDPIRTAGVGGTEHFEAENRTTKIWRSACKDFVLNGVFVEPSARKKGVGKLLIDAALEQASGDVPNSSTSTSVTVLVDRENEDARRLYARSGFVVAGEETYTQQPRALLGEGNPAERVALRMRLEMGHS